MFFFFFLLKPYFFGLLVGYHQFYQGLSILVRPESQHFLALLDHSCSILNTIAAVLWEILYSLIGTWIAHLLAEDSLGAPTQTLNTHFFIGPSSPVPCLVESRYFGNSELCSVSPHLTGTTVFCLGSRSLLSGQEIFHRQTSGAIISLPQEFPFCQG